MRLLAIMAVLAGPAAADIRIATFNASLNRPGPGMLLGDLMEGEDPQIAAVAEIILRVRPDILLLNEFDHDLTGAALAEFQALLAAGGGGQPGLDYPHAFAAPSNTGVPSGLDLDGDGSVVGPGDAYGFGNFPGQYGMALLSRYPVDDAATRTFQLLPWRDLPGAELPRTEEGGPFPSEEAQAEMRLSSKSHWDVVIETPDGPFHVLASHPTPPVFDGPEDRNGLRNRDEIRFWSLYLDGTALPDDQGRTTPFAGTAFAVMGDLNADPADGDGRREAMQALLAHPRLQDPVPTSRGGALAAPTGANADHRGDPAVDTADFRDDPGPGNLRVDYVLPAASLTVTDTGVFWPAEGEDGHALVEKFDSSSDHRLVWVDLTFR